MSRFGCADHLHNLAADLLCDHLHFGQRFLLLHRDINLTRGTGADASAVCEVRKSTGQGLFHFCYRGESGLAMVRHMWATGLLSFPRPSFGCLKCRTMISTNGSMVTTAFGSNEYRSLIVTSLDSM